MNESGAYDDGTGFTSMIAMLERMIEELSGGKAANENEIVIENADAMAQFVRQKLEKDPNNAFRRANFAKLLLNLGERFIAMSSFRYAEKNLEEAMTNIDHAISISGETFGLLMVKALVLFNIGRVRSEMYNNGSERQYFTKSVTIFDELLDAHPDNPEILDSAARAYSGLGFYYQNNEQPNEARRLYEKVVKIRKGFFERQPRRRRTILLYASALYQTWTASPDMTHLLEEAREIFEILEENYTLSDRERKTKAVIEEQLLSLD